MDECWILYGVSSVDITLAHSSPGESLKIKFYWF